MKSKQMLTKLTIRYLKSNLLVHVLLLFSIVMTTFMLTGIFLIAHGFAYQVQLFSRDVSNALMIYIVAAIIAFLFILTGYLMIDNVLGLNVANDAKFYGRLKSLGLTNFQLKKMMTWKINTLSLVGISFGLVVGTFAAIPVAPYINAHQSAVEITGDGVLTATEQLVYAQVMFEAVVYVMIFLFVYFSVFLGSTKAIKRVAKLPPIEGVGYAYEISLPIDACKPVRNKKWLMAKRQVIQHKKRLRMVVCSLFLSLFIVVLTTLITSSLSTERHTSAEMNGFEGSFIVHANNAENLTKTLADSHFVVDVNLEEQPWGGYMLAISSDEVYDQEIYSFLNDERLVYGITRIEARFIINQNFAQAVLTLQTIGSLIGLILGISGLFNLINAISMSILSRKRQFNLMECVGLLKTDLKRILIYENVIVIGFTLGVSIFIGFPLIALFYLLLAGVWGDFMSFTVPFSVWGVILLVILIISFTLPTLLLKFFYKGSIIDRLRKS